MERERGREREREREREKYIYKIINMRDIYTEIYRPYRGRYIIEDQTKSSINR